MPTFPAEVEKRERERAVDTRAFLRLGNDDGGKDVETQAFVVVAALSSKRNPRGVDRSSLDRSSRLSSLFTLCQT